MTWIKDIDGNRVWTGPCGCGLTPEEHIAMTLEARQKHKTIPPKGQGRT